MPNPTDIARLGHRFQVRLAHTSGQALVASRVQRFEPAIRQDQTVYHELGTVDPTGYSAEPPQFNIGLDEFVHSSNLDLLLAGKTIASDTTWNLGDYNVGNGPVTLYLLERDNLGVVQGELQFTNGIITDITWSWRMGQPIDARYTVLARLGQRWTAANVPHTTWGAQDTSAPGGIRIKDARLYLNGGTDGYRQYRVQGFTLRAQWRSQIVNEAGNRAMVGILAEPPNVTLDVDFAHASLQPDDVVYATGGSGTYYDYQNTNALSASVIRVFDPDAAEGASVVRAWKLEKLRASNVTPATANVGGLATKRYEFVVPGVTTPNSGGLICYKGDVA
jgi:hypothetical protein